MSSLTERIEDRRASPHSGRPGPLGWRPGRRGVLLGGIAALIVIVAAVAIVALARGGSGPATGAAALVPADALAYVNVSTDRSRQPVEQTLELTRRFPDSSVISAGVLSRLEAVVGGARPAAFSRDIRPWLGNEVAIAFLNTASSAAGSLIVLRVSDQPRAEAFLGRSGASAAGSYRGTRLLRYPSGTELAFVHGFLALGQDASVRAAVDVATGRSPSLQNDAAYKRAAAGEPDDRVLDAYASAAGVQRILASRTGAIGALGTLLYKPALEAVTLSLSPATQGARIRIHSVLDPSLTHLRGAPTSPYSPTLQRVAPVDSILLFDTGGLSRVAPEVLGAASAAGIGGQIGPLLERLGSALSAEGVNVRSLTSIFSGESAVVITPPSVGPLVAPRPPALIIVARTKHEAQTRAALAALEVPLAQLFPAPSSGPGQAPEFNDVQIDGITAHELSLTAGLQLVYAVFNGLVVVSTSRAGIAAVISHNRSLAGEQEFRSALAGRPDQVASLLFLDFSQLLSLAEQTGLTRSTRLLALAPDLERIRAVGMDSTGGEADTTAELFLQIQ